MMQRRLGLVLLLGGLALSGTGCEWLRWLRLLSLKKQLADLDRFVLIDDQHGLTLRFLKPVAYADDLRLLVQDATTHTNSPDRQTWVWTYQKQPPEPAGNASPFDLSFSVSFDHLKFSELFFPENFLTILPKPMILGLLRSLGRAEVDVKHGNISFKWAGTGNERLVLPTKAQVIGLLGPPFSITESNLTHSYLYKYYQQTRSPESPADRLAWAKFTFERESERVLTSQGGLGNMGWSLRRVPGQSEIHVTVSLLAMSVEPVALNLPAEITDQYLGQYQDNAGRVLNFRRDGPAFAASWRDKGSAGWCAALPESTNSFFALPSGDPSWTFLSDQFGVVTGVVSHARNSQRVFSRGTNQWPKSPDIVRVAPQVFEACSGTYKPSWGGRVILSTDGQRLYWGNAGVSTRFPLYPASDTDFFFKLVDSSLTFIRNDKGTVTGFVLHYCGHNANAEKLKAP